MDPLMNNHHHDAAPSAAVKGADASKCRSCGGEAYFDPDQGVLICSHCGSSSEVRLEQRAILEHDFDTADQSANVNWGALKKIFHCNNCGADSLIDGHNIAQFCAFCGSTHVVRYEDAAGIAPDGVIPFKVSQQTAIANFKTWVAKRFFAPGALKSTYRKQSLSGVYIPFWSYSVDVQANYNAEAGTHYFVTERKQVVRDGKKEMVEQRVRKTRWRRVNSTYNCSFSDYLVNASKQIQNRLMSRIEPYNLNDLMPYSPDFLAGFLAEKYSIGLKEGWAEARKTMERDLERDIKSHLGADEVRNLSINSSYQNRRYRHLLLPVWISSYTFNKKIYHFMINGQTGRVSGESPVSTIKVALVIAAVLAFIALVITML